MKNNENISTAVQKTDSPLIDSQLQQGKVSSDQIVNNQDNNSEDVVDSVPQTTESPVSEPPASEPSVSEPQVDEPQVTEIPDAQNAEGNYNPVGQKPDSQAAEADNQPVKSVSAGAKPFSFYVVKNGDSLSKISENIYNSINYVHKIMELNKINDADRICEGQKLWLPEP